MGTPDLVLASNSPRRRELLALGGWKFQVHPAEVDESQLPGESPGPYVLRLALAKAQACDVPARKDTIILAADTAVVDQETILGKPKDPLEARAMLVRLKGRTHQVFTALAILEMSSGYEGTDLCITDVPMRAYGDKEIDRYIATGDPLDKAGAYAIQHPQFHPVGSLNGCYASVMGLPLCHLVRTLKKIDIIPRNDIPAECQSSLGYVCPIFTRVLGGETVG